MLQTYALGDAVGMIRKHKFAGVVVDMAEEESVILKRTKEAKHTVARFS